MNHEEYWRAEAEALSDALGLEADDEKIKIIMQHMYDASRSECETTGEWLESKNRTQRRESNWVVADKMLDKLYSLLPEPNRIWPIGGLANRMAHDQVDAYRRLVKFITTEGDFI